MDNTYKKMYDKFQVATEILTNRYLINAILVNQNNIMYYLEERLKLERSLVPEDVRKKLQSGLRYRDNVAFDRFTISARRFNALVKKYGAEVVSKSCIILDKHLKTMNKEYMDSTIQKRLNEIIDVQMGKKRASECLDEAIAITMAMDYKLINDEATARQYIKGTPWYKQSIDEGCIYLKEKFDIKE